MLAGVFLCPICLAMKRLVLRPLLSLVFPLAAAWGWATSAHAQAPDQEDQFASSISDRLDEIFAQLAFEQDPVVANQLLSESSQLWLVIEDIEAQSLMTYGLQAMRFGALPQSIELFERVTQQEPDYIEGWNKLATALFYAGRLQESEPITRRVLELDPRHYGALWGMGMITEGQGRLDEAVRWYQLAYSVAPAILGPLERSQLLTPR